ncbi:TIR domain-containing protein [Streptomyces sp. NPDC096136]|uniref:TIR domain-containing protein n=1 Tax=Streptomyces sp. NPDC096136 TaxID=3366076 RepID=UPI003814EF54
MSRRRDAAIEYDAFISYSHAWDKDLAKAFQSRLQTFDRPWYRPRSLKLFRDETNLAASPHLWAEIERGLTRSRWLVLMASPAAAASPWVRAEIRWWLTHRSVDTLLIAWTEGTLVWDPGRRAFDWSRSDALPHEELAHAFTDEPRWVDLRWLRHRGGATAADPRLIECAAEFVAPLTGKSKDELIGDHVRQHRRTIRTVRATIAVLTALLLTAVAGGIAAYEQRNEALTQTLVAQSRQLAAEARSIQDTQPDLARQLLVQAYRLAPTAEATGALVESGTLPRVIHAHGYARSAAYSSQGLLAVADDDVRLLEPATGGPPTPLDAPQKKPTAVAFSADGHLLAVGTGQGEVRLLDVTSSRRPRSVAVTSAVASPVTSLVFAADGRLFVMADKGGTILDAKDPSHPVPLGPLPGTTVAASPAGNLIATQQEEGALSLWVVSATAQLRLTATLTSPPVQLVFPQPQHVMFSANGQVLALGSQDNRVRLWDVADPAHPVVRPDIQVTSTLGVVSVAFSPDGTTLATAGHSGVVWLWDISDPTRPRSGARLSGHTSEVGALAFGPDGRTLASVSSDGTRPSDGLPPTNQTVRLWPLSGHERSSSLADLPLAGGYPPAFSPDSSLLASGMPTEVWRLNARNGPRHESTLETYRVGGQAVAFGPDGHTVVSGIPAITWDTTDPAHPNLLTPGVSRSDGAESIAFNPSLPLVAMSSLGGPVQLWDITDRARPALLATLDNAPLDHHALAFSADGVLLAALGHSGSVRLWRVREHAQPTAEGMIEPTGTAARSLAFSPHGRTLLVGDDRGSLTSWNLDRPGRPRRMGTSDRHTGAVEGLAYHPDGTLAASAGEDGLIRLWAVGDPARLVEVTSLSDGNSLPAAVSLAFSPDGRLLAGSGTRGVQLWTVDPGAILRRLCAESIPITRDQWAQYLPGRDYDPPCA